LLSSEAIKQGGDLGFLGIKNTKIAAPVVMEATTRN
jgi:hypothetical protein